MREQLKWYDDKADNSPWIDALAELRQRATREGHCFQHVQAITLLPRCQYPKRCVAACEAIPPVRTGDCILGGSLDR